MMIWNNKITSADRFAHIGRHGYFVCYYGNDEWVYPADDGVEWLARMDEHTRWQRRDCKKLHDIFYPKFESVEQMQSEFKTLYVNPYFFKL